MAIQTIQFPKREDFPKQGCNIGALYQAQDTGNLYVATVNGAECEYCPYYDPKEPCKDGPKDLDMKELCQQVGTQECNCREALEEEQKRSNNPNLNLCTNCDNGGDDTGPKVTINVDMVIGFSHLYKGRYKTCECDPPKIDLSIPDSVEKFKNMYLVIDGKENAANDINVGKFVCGKTIPGKDPDGKKTSFRFPIEYPLTSVYQHLQTLIQDAGDDPCELYKLQVGGLETKTIPITKVSFPKYKTCVPQSSGTGRLPTLIEEVRRRCFHPDVVIQVPGFPPSLPSQDHLDGLISAGQSPQATPRDIIVGRRALLCKTPLLALQQHPCAYTIQKWNQNLGVYCPSDQYKKMCDVISCIAKAGDSDPDPQQMTVSISDINAYIIEKSDNTDPVKKDPCVATGEITSSVRISRQTEADGSETINITIILGEECPDDPDDPSYTKNKITYAVLRNRLSAYGPQYCDSENACDCIEMVKIDGKFKSINKVNGNTIVIDAPPNEETTVWQSDIYKFSSFRCKSCSDAFVKKYTEKFCNEDPMGFCCRPGNDLVASGSLEWIYKSTCCDYIDRGQEAFFFGHYQKNQRNLALEECMPTVKCCIPGAQDGGVCVYKARSKPALEFDIELEVNTCSLDKDKNNCNVTTVGSDTRPQVGSCKVFSRCELGVLPPLTTTCFYSTTRYKILLDNGDFNYVDLLGPNGIQLGPLKSDLIKYRACQKPSSSGASYCQNVRTKEELIADIKKYGYDEQNNKMYKLYTETECEQLGQKASQSLACSARCSKHIWTSITPTGDAERDGPIRRSIEYSCKDFMDGPKTQKITVPIRIESVCWDQTKPLNSANVFDLVMNTKPVYKNKFKTAIFNELQKVVTFKPALCTSDFFGTKYGGLFACITEECCKQQLTIEAKADGRSDVEVAWVLGAAKLRTASGTFLCENFPGQINILEPTVPGPTVTPPPYVSAVQYVAETRDKLLEDNNKFKIINIKLDKNPCEQGASGLKSFYIPDVNPVDGKAECEQKAKEFLSCCKPESEVKEVSDYIFIPSYTTTKGMDLAVDNNGNITYNTNLPTPGSCIEKGPKQSYPEAALNNIYNPPRHECEKVGGVVVEDCDDCDSLNPPPKFPDPDPDDPTDPNDPPQPSPKPPDATITISYPLKNDTITTKKFKLDLPVNILGKTYGTVNGLLTGLSDVSARESLISFVLSRNGILGTPLAACRIISIDSN